MPRTKTLKTTKTKPKTYQRLEIKTKFDADDLKEIQHNLKIYIETTDFPTLTDFAVQHCLCEKKLRETTDIITPVEFLENKFKDSVIRKAAEGILKPHALSAILKYIKYEKKEKKNFILSFPFGETENPDYNVF